MARDHAYGLVPAPGLAQTQKARQLIAAANAGTRDKRSAAHASLDPISAAMQ